MNVPDFIRRLFDRGRDEEEQYRCIHCGDEFDTDYHDCPSCGQPYVVELDE